jgi:hypothetical protein
MLTHRNKKPFECKAEGCGKSYCDARSLRRHTENHHTTPAGSAGARASANASSASASAASSSGSSNSEEGTSSSCIQYAPPPPYPATSSSSSSDSAATSPSQLQQLLSSPSAAANAANSPNSPSTSNQVRSLIIYHSLFVALSEILAFFRFPVAVKRSAKPNGKNIRIYYCFSYFKSFSIIMRFNF